MLNQGKVQRLLPFRTENDGNQSVSLGCDIFDLIVWEGMGLGCRRISQKVRVSNGTRRQEKGFVFLNRRKIHNDRNVKKSKI